VALTRTLGTNANNSLGAFLVGTDDLTAAQLAALNVAIKNDPPGYGAWPAVGTTGLVTGTGTNRPTPNQAYVKQGLLIIPNRGHLQLKPGDFVAVDPTTGWPIVVSGDCAANGAFTHT
jgi:hypothetical protein